MNGDERIAEQYLKSIHIGEVVHEPDGKVPPDFVVDGRIAVEVRRLNQHYEADGKLRGLEQDSISLHQSLENLLGEFAAPQPAATWFACFSFRRPLPDWRTLRTLLRDALSSFLTAPTDHLWRVAITESFDLTILPSTEIREKCFLFGACTDMDAGGWIVSEVVRNASAFISAKALKVGPYLDRYPVWWLVLVDYIALGREEDDVRKHISRSEPWGRVVILSPSGERAYEI